jgi:hypothetical protein
MAILIPDSCPSRATVGEKRIFGLLRDTLPDHFIAWYEPVVAGRHPDFTLVADDFGLLMLEVKGWYAEQITRADDNEVELHRTEGGEARVEIHEHPDFCDFCGQSRDSRRRDVRRSVGVPGSTERGVFPRLLRIVRFVREGSRLRNPDPALGAVLSQRVAFSLSTSRTRHRGQTGGSMPHVKTTPDRSADRQRPPSRRRTSSRRPRAQSAQFAEIESPCISANCAISAERVVAPGRDPSGLSWECGSPR